MLFGICPRLIRLLGNGVEARGFCFLSAAHRVVSPRTAQPHRYGRLDDFYRIAMIEIVRMQEMMRLFAHGMT